MKFRKVVERATVFAIRDMLALVSGRRYTRFLVLKKSGLDDGDDIKELSQVQLPEVSLHRKEHYRAVSETVLPGCSLCPAS